MPLFHHHNILLLYFWYLSGCIGKFFCFITLHCLFDPLRSHFHILTLTLSKLCQQAKATTRSNVPSLSMVCDLLRPPGIGLFPLGPILPSLCWHHSFSSPNSDSLGLFSDGILLPQPAPGILMSWFIPKFYVLLSMGDLIHAYISPYDL